MGHTCLTLPHMTDLGEHEFLRVCEAGSLGLGGGAGGAPGDVGQHGLQVRGPGAPHRTAPLDVLTQLSRNTLLDPRTLLGSVFLKTGDI
jgi:hypothetical protein